MNLWRLSLAYLRHQKLTAALNVFLLALGSAIIVVLLLASTQLKDNLVRDAGGIDLVVGAKGSPLQLILSSIYHIDAPTGNIDLAEARRWSRHRLVDRAIPVALGDSVQGFRIVGTSDDFLPLYDAEFAGGRGWHAPMQAVLGAQVAAATGLSVGDNFAGVHGFAASGHTHEDSRYTVVGVLAPTRSVIDRLALTDVRSVWALHGGLGHDHGHEDEHAADDHGHEHEHEHDEDHTHGHAEQPGAPDHDHHDTHAAVEQAPLPSVLEPDFPATGRQITALLLISDSPLAALTLPRLINRVSSLQAAAPVAEITRLLGLIGFGLDTLAAFAGLMIAAAALSVFVALYNALRARRVDLAMMRSLGASRVQLLRHILLEGQMLALGGVTLGLLIGHLVTEGLGLWLQDAQLFHLTGWAWQPAEWGLLVMAVVVGLLAALLPAIQAYRVDIARTLAGE
ncbi:FtsX-like permease family protein [Salinisphaera sp.]|uniref:ABC transporter permease n=1 Tax=Salinisphaera sp. TaxID=1914330 RepID=UPI000C3EB61B|nr:FtsX-like permease family protein [Salinisphaera sp.]MBS61559.1 multidrug ABC transporter substrate-binding protein [Salinisphaera sp.]